MCAKRSEGRKTFAGSRINHIACLAAFTWSKHSLLKVRLLVPGPTTGRWCSSFQQLQLLQLHQIIHHQNVQIYTVIKASAISELLYSSKCSRDEVVYHGSLTFVLLGSEKLWNFSFFCFPFLFQRLYYFTTFRFVAFCFQFVRNNKEWTIFLFFVKVGGKRKINFPYCEK